jgi:hypothetical protein
MSNTIIVTPLTFAAIGRRGSASDGVDRCQPNTADSLKFVAY